MRIIVLHSAEAADRAKAYGDETFYEYGSFAREGHSGVRITANGSRWSMSPDEMEKVLASYLREDLSKREFIATPPRMHIHIERGETGNAIIYHQAEPHGGEMGQYVHTPEDAMRYLHQFLDMHTGIVTISTNTTLD